jgi:AcrR family transcriptional regulator
VRRGVRNREAIVEALFELIGAGTIQPTAEQVAERAGVRVRTVFRHFDDMAGLNAELIRLLRSEMKPLFETTPEGDAAERARALVGQRAAAFERIAPYKRAADAQRWRRDYLQTDHEALVRELRRLNLRALPELRDATDDVQAAFELVVSYEAWQRLRVDQRLGLERARAAMECAALAVLEREAR